MIELIFKHNPVICMILPIFRWRSRVELDVDGLPTLGKFLTPTLIPLRVTVKRVSAFWLSNNKWRWWM